MFTPTTNILIVDDMMTMRKIVQKSMKDLGFCNFTLAKDGAEALKILKAKDPEIGLIISDWNMPNKTGLELLKEVRADSELAATPFVMVTAESESHQVMEAIQAGVSNYLVKPFSAAQLKEKLQQIKQRAA